jgi:hypothetical protein
MIKPATTLNGGMTKLMNLSNADEPAGLSDFTGTS